MQKLNHNTTELTWFSLLSDELTNGQVTVAYVTTLTYASTNDQQVRPACPLISSSKTKPCQFSSVTSLCTRLNSVEINREGATTSQRDQFLLKLRPREERIVLGKKSERSRCPPARPRLEECSLGLVF